MGRCMDGWMDGCMHGDTQMTNVSAVTLNSDVTRMSAFFCQFSA